MAYFLGHQLGALLITWLISRLIRRIGFRRSSGRRLVLAPNLCTLVVLTVLGGLALAGGGGAQFGTAFAYYLPSALVLIVVDALRARRKPAAVPASSSQPLARLLFPKNPLRLVGAAVVGLTLGCFLVYRQGWINPLWYVYHPHVRDEAGVMGMEDHAGLEHTVRFIRRESGVDLWILLVPTTGQETIEAFAVRRARELGIGQETNRRSALLLFDAGTRRMRIEVGPRLEDVFTDAFIGYLLREHLRTFMEAGSPSLGLRTTLMMTQDRIRRTMLREGFDSTFLTFIEDHRRLAEGAGATARLAGAAEQRFMNRPSSALARAYFTPQPTVEQAFQRYLEWCALDEWLPDVPLFTDPSISWLMGLPMTRPYQRFMIAAELGAPHVVVERGSLALLVFTADPLLGPHFFRKMAGRWQMDMMAEVTDTRNYIGGWASWTMVDTGDDFNAAFADRMVAYDGVVRLAGGDNRPIPAPGEAPTPRPVMDSSVTWLSVTEAAGRIRAARGRPAVVLIYCPCSAEARQVVAEVSALARQHDEVDFLAFGSSSDQSGRYIGDLLRNSGAPFPAFQLYPWPTGKLLESLATVGVGHEGTEWENPMFAVLNAQGKAVAQGEGLTGVGPIAAALRQLPQER